MKFAVHTKVKSGTKSRLLFPSPSFTRRPSWLLFAIPLLLVWGALQPVLAQGEPPSEYEVKAAFLYNFAKFVEWPASALPSEHSPLVIGILGEDPFGHFLDDVVRGKNVNGHEFRILRSQRLEDLKDCQILFISSSENRHLSELLESLAGKSILLVGETGTFAQLGGTIDFVLQENHVRFKVNVDAAGRARLKISSKLLALAEVVRDDPRRSKD